MRHLPMEGHVFRDFACGDRHIVAVTTAGAIYEWGDRRSCKKKTSRFGKEDVGKNKHSLDLWKSMGNPESSIFYMYLAILLLCRESSVSWAGRHRFETTKLKWFERTSVINSSYPVM